MTESVTISKSTPELESMQYETLRAAGLERIKKLSSGIWTDYNAHDPGITILEALSYAITDLGYRLTFEIKDLLTAETGSTVDYKNFYTARQILHTAPVTINDYRKLLMDVAIEYTSSTGDKEWLGVRNAWLTKSPKAELAIFANLIQSKLELKQTYPEETSFYVKGLYDILFEFDESDSLGDLNENTITQTYVIENFPDDDNMEGTEIQITVAFPRWDEKEVNFNNNNSIIENIESITFNYDNLPSGYELAVEVNPVTKALTLTGTRPSSGGIENIPNLVSLEPGLNNFVFDNTNSMLSLYKEKIKVIRDIMLQADKKLHQNRNLCEDFYKKSALRVEEIAICSDIEVDNSADINKVTAAIYHDIALF